MQTSYSFSAPRARVIQTHSAHIKPHAPLSDLHLAPKATSLLRLRRSNLEPASHIDSTSRHLAPQAHFSLTRNSPRPPKPFYPSASRHLNLETHFSYLRPFRPTQTFWPVGISTRHISALPATTDILARWHSHKIHLGPSGQPKP